MSRKLLINLTLAGVSLLVTVLGAELALRWVLLRNLNPFEPDPQIGYRLKADFDGAYPRVPVRTDARRRRVPTEAAGSPTGRLAFVGDSVTFGFGVLAREAFPHQVGVLLDRPDDVANLAVPGYNLAQALVTLREELAESPVEVAVYGAVVNDVGNADRPATYGDIDPHASRLEAGGPLARSVLVAFVLRRWRRLAAGWSDGDETAGAGVDGTSPERQLPRLTDDMEAASRPAAVAAFDAQLRELAATDGATDAPVLVLVLPFRDQLERPDLDAWQRFMADRCGRFRLRCLDPLPMLVEHRQETLFNGDSSYHFNPRGHRLLAEWLAPRLPVPSP